jgi:ribosomal protein S18 acetylase RimI-like enzyme
MSLIDFYISTEFSDVADFDSGIGSFNRYLHQHPDESVLHYIIDSSTGQLIGYFALTSSALPYRENGNLKGLSAIELKMFAIDNQYQGKGLAEHLLDGAFGTIKYYAEEYIGAKMIILYSVPVNYVLDLYEKLGFKRMGNDFVPFVDEFTDGCIPMFKAL